MIDRCGIIKTAKFKGETKMPQIEFNRDRAFTLLTEYNSNDSLIKHALSVEAVMKHFAGLYNDPGPETWGIAGLVHDLAYERYPDEHCVMIEDILRSNGAPEVYIHAAMSHGYGICSDVEPLSIMEKVLFTIDELTGLVTAAALVRPSKSVLDLEARSVMKKWAQKGFAAGVDRSVIEKGAHMLELELVYIVEQTIAGMRNAAKEIGL